MSTPLQTMATLLLYLGLAALFTYPLPQDPRGYVLGYTGFENTPQTLWLYAQWKAYVVGLYDALREAGVAGLPTVVWQVLALPVKVSMANGVDFVSTAPLEWLFGFPAYYNVKCWLILATNAMAGWWLVCSLSGSRVAGLAAGAAFAFNPFTFYLLLTGRIIEAIHVWLALYVLFLWKAWNEEPVRWPILAGLCLGLATLTYWFYGYFLVAFTVLFLAWHARGPRLLPRLGRIATAGLVALVLIVPAGMPYVSMLARGENIPGGVRPDPGGSPGAERERYLKQLLRFSCDLEYGLFPPPPGPGGGWNPPWSLPTQHTFSTVLTVTALLALLAVPAAHRFWLLAFPLLYLLPMGPFLKMGGHIVTLLGHPVPLPYYGLVASMPLLDRLYFPNQGMAMWLLAVAVALGFGVAWAMRVHSRWAMLACLLLLATTTLEMWARNQLPLPLSRVEVPAVYARARGGFVYLPANLRFWESSGFSHQEFYLGSDLTHVDQHIAAHGRKALWGRNQYLAGRDYWMFEPETALDNSFLRFLLDLDRTARTYRDADRRQVVASGFDHVVVLERLCAHIPDGGAYRVDLEGGARRFEDMCRRLRREMGAPVHEGPDPSWDQGILRDFVVYHAAYRMAIFRIPGGQP